MTRRLVTAILIAAFALLFAVLAFAAPPPSLPGYHVTADATDAAGRRVLTYTQDDAPPADPGGYVDPPAGAIVVRAGQPLAVAAGRVTALERGGTWAVKNYSLPDNCTLASYGDPAKPLPVLRAVKGESCVYVNGRKGVTLDRVAFVGSGAAPAVRFLAGGGGHRMTGCDVSGGSFGVTSEGKDAKHRIAGLQLLACDVHDNFNATPGADGSGVFASYTDGLVIDHCVLDGNGWDRAHNGTQTVRCHDLYHNASCGPIVLTNNVISDPAAHGAQVRSGGTVTGNVFFRCPLGLDFGVVGGGGPVHVGGVSGTVSGNVFAGSRDIGRDQRGISLEVGNVLRATVSGNLFGAVDHAYACINLEACKADLDPKTKKPLAWEKDAAGIVDLTVSGNKAWGRQGPWLGLLYGAKMGGPGERGNLIVQRLAQSGNVWQPAAKSPDLAALLGDPVTRVRRGERVEDLVAACFRAAEVVR